MRKVAVVAGVASLVLFTPFLGEVYGAVGDAAGANQLWVIVAALCVALGFVSTWALQRVALRAERWSDVAVPQLAGNAASNVLPAGSALGAAVQLRMLARNGIDLTRAVTALAVVGLVSLLAGLIVMPLVLVVPVGSDQLVDTAAISRFALVALLLCIPLVIAVLKSDRAMRLVANGCQRTLQKLPRVRPREDLAKRIVAERDSVRAVLREHKLLVLVTCVGRTCGDYFALYAAMLAAGLHLSPAVVLLAFIAGNTAGMVPITPGGLGFVEAGISGTIVVAGGADERALAAVAIYRLVSCWLPVVLGMAAYAWSARMQRVSVADVVTTDVDVVTTDVGAIVEPVEVPEPLVATAS